MQAPCPGYTRFKTMQRSDLAYLAMLPVCQRQFGFGTRISGMGIPWGAKNGDICTVAWALVAAHVPTQYIAMACLILLGIGIFTGVTRTRAKDPS